VFGKQEFDIAAADAVLSGARAVESQCADPPLLETLRFGSFGSSTMPRWEIALSGMAEVWCPMQGSENVLLCLGDEVGQPRDWHANVSHAHLCVLAQRIDSTISIVSCLPQLSALFGGRLPQAKCVPP
jgi:hypothetical protein